MGAVYRARDTQLGRDVALKVLLPEVADDPDRLARFQREAHVLAALNHPHIAAIYGFEHHDGVSALVIELVDGEDLAETIGRGPIPLRESLRIATQIVEALEAAHEQGIVHRDLKPANIKVRAEGTVKVLDFGLAKAMTSGSQPSGAVSLSPTFTSPAMMTGVGMILGTAAYMSPEQARGSTVDRRADLWAFGVILFEMLSGQRLFDGGTVSDTLASVLKSDPDWSLLPPDTPVPIRRLLRRCLEKDRRERLDSAADARLEIQEALRPELSDATSPPAPLVAARTARLPWAIAAMTTVAAVALLIAWASARRASVIVDQPLMEFDISPPEGTTFGPPRSSFRSVAVSPDGRQLAMVAGPRDGKSMIWIRPLASNTPRAIAGTENAAHPFWSPDGKVLGFLASGKIKRVDVNGGQPQVVGDTGRPGGAFDSAGMLLLTRNNQPLFRVPAGGGSATPLFPLDAARKESGQYDPVFLPDGKHLVYSSTGPEMGLVYVSLDGAVRKFLFPQRSSPADYAPDPAGDGGWLLYVLRNQLVARRFNPATGDVAGEPARLADNVVNGPSFSVSTNGVLTFRHVSQPKRQLTWFTRDGKQQNALGEDQSGVGRPRISPDGRSVAVERATEGSADIYIESSAGGSATRFTFEAGDDTSPLWSPDGQRLYYSSVRGDKVDLIERPANGVGAERVLFRGESGRAPQPVAVTRDGGWLLVRVGGAGQSTLSFLSLADGKIVPFPETDSVTVGSLSPDGRWIAYAMRSGSLGDVFVRGVPKEMNGSAVDAKRQISTGGAGQPIWRADGREIVYMTADGTLMSVSVEATDGVLRTGPPRALFKVGETATLDLTGDGQRFLVNRAVSESDPQVTVIVNWTKLLVQ
jgi:serine/threonine protein kinase/Tol biopolymer transport system component